MHSPGLYPKPFHLQVCCAPGVQILEDHFTFELLLSCLPWVWYCWYLQSSLWYQWCHLLFCGLWSNDIITVIQVLLVGRKRFIEKKLMTWQCPNQFSIVGTCRLRVKGWQTMALALSYEVRFHLLILQRSSPGLWREHTHTGSHLLWSSEVPSSEPSTETSNKPLKKEQETWVKLISHSRNVIVLWIRWKAFCLSAALISTLVLLSASSPGVSMFKVASVVASVAAYSTVLPAILPRKQAHVWTLTQTFRKDYDHQSTVRDAGLVTLTAHSTSRETLFISIFFLFS